MADFKEEDMYKPIEKYFKNLGYKVDGEVADCDVVCIKENEIIVIEMKKVFSTKLLYQGMRRQKITEKVYIAIPKPKKYTLQKRSEIISICKGLGLGAILINMNKSSKDKFQIILEPEKKANVLKYRYDKVLKEFEGRSLNINKGGVTNKKINTAFKERNIKIACALELIGEGSAKNLIKYYECFPKTNMLLSNNTLGWYDRVGHGQYKINKYGLEKLHSDEFKEIYKFYSKEIKTLHKKIIEVK